MIALATHTGRTLSLYNAASPRHFGRLTPSSLISMLHCPHEPQGGPQGSW